MHDRNNPLRAWLDSIANSGHTFSRNEIAAEIDFNGDVTRAEQAECLRALVGATMRMATAHHSGERARARRIAADVADDWADLIAYPDHPSDEIADNDHRGLADAINRISVT